MCFLTGIASCSQVPACVLFNAGREVPFQNLISTSTSFWRTFLPRGTYCETCGTSLAIHICSFLQRNLDKEKWNDIFFQKTCIGKPGNCVVSVQIHFLYLWNILWNGIFDSVAAALITLKNFQKFKWTDTWKEKGSACRCAPTHPKFHQGNGPYSKLVALPRIQKNTKNICAVK